MSMPVAFLDSIFSFLKQLYEVRLQSRVVVLMVMVLKFCLEDLLLVLVFLFPQPYLNNFLLSLVGWIRSYEWLLSLSICSFLSFYVIAFALAFSLKKQLFINIFNYFYPFLVTFLLPFTLVSVKIFCFADSFIAAILGSISFLLILIILLLESMFNFTITPQVKNYLQRRKSKTLMISVWCRFIFAVYLTVASDNQTNLFTSIQSKIYSFMLFAISLPKINCVFSNVYANAFAHELFTLVYFSEITILFMAFLNNVILQDTILKNTPFIVLLTMGLGFWAFKNYTTQRDKDICLSTIAEMKSDEAIFLYLKCLNDLIVKVRKEEEDMILISLKKKHQMKCSNEQCYCVQSISTQQFMNHYVLEELNKLSMAEYRSPDVLYSILNFKLLVFDYYPEIVSTLNRYSTQFNLSYQLTFVNYCLRHSVKDFIDQRNSQINAIESESMFLLETIKENIETIITNQIETRCKKWKYLAKGICRVRELEDSCNMEMDYIIKIMNIYDKHRIRFKKSKEYNIFLIFYFQKVSFLNFGADLKQNLKEIYFGFKTQELHSLKQFRKFIYHKDSCAIQTLVDSSQMGIITTASKNTQSLFGFAPNKLIGLSVNKLMPQFMGNEHDFILKDWTQTGTWRTIGKLKEIYCVHKDQFCFSAFIYLKIYIKNNSMYFITNFFKLNEHDYLVLNPNLKIEGIGKKFLKFLGEPAKKVSINVLIENFQIHHFSKCDEKPIRRIFYGLKGMEENVEKYVLELALKPNAGQRAAVNQNFSQLLKEKSEKYLVQFSVKSYQMKSVSFKILTLIEAKRFDVRLVERPVSRIINKEEEVDEMLEKYNENLSSRNISDENNDSIDGEQIFADLNANSSLRSVGGQESFPLTKLMNYYLDCLKDPSLISDQRLIRFSFMCIFTIALLSAINFVAYQTYKNTLFEIESIFFADGAASDIMQLTEFSYGLAYTLWSIMGHASPQQFQSAYNSERLILVYVYAYRESNFQDLMTALSQFKKQRLYSYLEEPATWTLNNQKTVPIQTMQFLQNYYYLTNEVMREIARERQLNYSSFQHQDQIKLIIANFPEMKRINEYFLDYYQDLSTSSHQSLNTASLISLFLFLAVSVTLSLLFNIYFQFRFQQNIESFKLFSLIPGHYMQKLKDYYDLLFNKIVETNLIKSIDTKEQEVFEIDSKNAFYKGQHDNNANLCKLRFVNYEKYQKWMLILGLVLTLNVGNYLFTSQIRNYFGPSEKMMELVNGLMREENRMIEAYYDMKSAYYINRTSLLNMTLYNKVHALMNQNEVTWNTVANQVISIFDGYDPTFKNTFIASLVGNVCNLSSLSPDLTPFENNKCINDLKLNLTTNGILISMNFYQRTLREAIEDLKLQYIDQTRPQYQGDYFAQLNFVELDKMQIYLFKIYQLTQANIYSSYITTIDFLVSSYFNANIIFLVLFAICLLIWLNVVVKQKLFLSKLYGHILLIPPEILKSSTRMVPFLKQNVEDSEH